MKVLHVIDSMVRGGAESLILEHIRHAGPGVETMVCALNRAGPAMEEAQALGARTRVLGKGGRIAAGLSGLAALMREWHIEVVNGHNPTGALYATLAARAAGVPAVFRSEQSIHYPGRHSRAYPLIEAGLTVFTRRVLCVCDAALESHARRLGWARRKFVTVYPGISEAPPLPSRDSLRAALGIAPDALAVISVGSLTRQKAQHVLIDAFARAAPEVPRAVLVIGGDGPLRATLEADVAARGLGDRIRLLGHFMQDVAEVVEACDVFALSSEREGMPITVLEAMRGRRAVVATRVGGVGEAVVDGVTGRLADVGDAAGLGVALTDTLRDPARLAAWGEAGHARWAERFGAERMVRETEALYAEALR